MSRCPMEAASSCPPGSEPSAARSRKAVAADTASRETSVANVSTGSSIRGGHAARRIPRQRTDDDHTEFFRYPQTGRGHGRHDVVVRRWVLHDKSGRRPPARVIRGSREQCPQSAGELRRIVHGMNHLDGSACCAGPSPRPGDTAQRVAAPGPDLGLAGREIHQVAVARGSQFAYGEGGGLLPVEVGPRQGVLVSGPSDQGRWEDQLPHDVDPRVLHVDGHQDRGVRETTERHPPQPPALSWEVVSSRS